MDDNLLVGCFSTAAAKSEYYFMIVDTRTAVRNKTLGLSGNLPARVAQLTLNAACSSKVVFVNGGDGGFEQAAQNEIGRHSANGGNITLSLVAGGGALIKVTGSLCGAVVAAVRKWRFNPRTLSLKGGSEIQLSGKSASFSRFGAARRHFAPGGPAGWESNYFIGGSYFENGAGFKNERDAVVFAQAGFSVASTPICGLKRALGYAAAYGNFIVATTQMSGNISHAMSATDALLVSWNYSCHTNFLGAIIANSAAAALSAGQKATAALKTHNWLFPIVLNVASVAEAETLATAGITPLPAVVLPAVGSGEGAAMAWAQETLDLLSTLGVSTSNRSLACSMAVTINACAYESESLNRAAAYWSVIFGSQALWWEGVGRCAAVGSAKFKLIASINRRLSQWAEPLFLKGSSTPAWNAAPRQHNGPPGSTPSSDCRHGANCFSEKLRYNVTHVYSTSSLDFPALQGIKPAKPGTNPAEDLIQYMDDDLIVIVLHNNTIEAPDSNAGIEFAHTKERYLLLLSTEVSTDKGGAATRQVTVKLRHDVTSTQPIEPDAFQGFASVPGSTTNSYNPTPEQGIPPTFRGDHKCPLSWLGNEMGSRVGNGQLRIAGGSAQLLSYSLSSDFNWAPPRAATADSSELHSQMVGRHPPKKVSGFGSMK